MTQPSTKRLLTEATGNLSTPSLTAPPHAAGRRWLSPKYGDLKVSNAVGDRRKIITGTLAHEGTVVQEPSVWMANGRYNMIYTGGTGTPVACYAYCPDTADPTVAANWVKNPTKVLGGGVGGQAGGLYHGNVYVEGSTLHFYYVDQATNKTIRRATAALSDPTTWTDQGVALNLAGPSMGNTFMLKIGSTYYMIYEASVDNWQLCIATATSPAGPFTSIQGEMSSLWARPTGSTETKTASGPWAVVEDGYVILYYHGGWAVSGSVPTDIFRARIPVGSFGTDAWTIDNNKSPILHRVAKEECDQVADAFVVTNAGGESFIFWEGYDNARSLATMFCQRLLPSERTSNGTIWQEAQAGGGGFGTTQPQKALTTVLATDATPAAGAYATVLTQTFRPTGPSVSVSVASASSMASGGQTAAFKVVRDGTGTTAQKEKNFGSFTQPNGGYQVAFSGNVLLDQLVPGQLYTITLQVKPGGGAWQCRPASFPENEQCSMVIRDAMFPNHAP